MVKLRLPYINMKHMNYIIYKSNQFRISNQNEILKIKIIAKEN